MHSNIRFLEPQAPKKKKQPNHEIYQSIKGVFRKHLFIKASLVKSNRILVILFFKFFFQESKCLFLCYDLEIL